MPTTPAMTLPTTANQPVSALGPWFQRLLSRLGSGGPVGRAGTASVGPDVDLQQADLIHEHRPVDRYDEYRRQAVERVLRDCPHHL